MLTYFAEYYESKVNEAEAAELRMSDLEWETLWTLAGLREAGPSMRIAWDHLMAQIPGVVWDLITADKCWLAGGMIRRWVAEEEMNSDFDLFFRTVDDKLACEQALAAAGYKEIFRCPEDKLTTFALERGQAEPIRVQCISNQYYTGPEHTIDTFDFTVSQFALDRNSLYTGSLSLLHLHSKVLSLHSLPYPAATMRRMIKYGSQGYWLAEETAQDFIVALISASQHVLGDGLIELTGGQFVDGREAHIDSDAFRWYID